MALLTNTKELLSVRKIKTTIIITTMVIFTELLTLIFILVGGSVVATAVPWVRVGPVRPVRAVVRGDAGALRVVSSSLSIDRDFNDFRSRRSRFRVSSLEGAAVDHRVAEFTQPDKEV